MLDGVYLLVFASVVLIVGIIAILFIDWLNKE